MKTDRRGFLKFLGLSAAAGVAAAVAPEVVKAPPVAPVVETVSTGMGPNAFFAYKQTPYAQFVLQRDIGGDLDCVIAHWSEREQRLIVHPEQYEFAKALLNPKRLEFVEALLAS